MATTVSYSASMRTRKTNSASNAKSSAASQEYYENTYNYVGIVHFAGMALSGKVITGITLRVVAAQAGYGTGHTKTVYVRKANYQSASQSGITGLGYCGDALGTFTGAFYGNTSTYTLSGDLLNNLAAYIAEGNNTICLYNPSPVKSSQGYSTNYLQWSECTITVTYEEAASKPSLSKTSFDMGTAVTIYTNRQSSVATHTLRYSFFSSNGTIATGVTTSCTWTPPVSLAAQIPNATSGWGTILCDTYVNGSLVSTNTCAFQLTVPASVVPSISSMLRIAEATAGIADRFGGYVRTRSKLSVSITAAGAQGSSISSLSHQYRRRDLFRLILHHQCAEYGGQSHNDRDSHRLSRTHGQHGPYRHRVGLFAAFAIPVYRRALQRGRNRRADGWYEGAHFRKGERLVRGR